jgi:hypothetical protein
MTKRRHPPPAVFLFLLLLTASCATTITSPPPPDFLRSTNASWNQWAEKVVAVHLTGVRITHLPLTDAFAGLRMVIARADEPIG